jgi:hypothetical protein
MAESGRLRADAEEHAAKLMDELERALAEVSAQRQRTVEQDEQLACLEGRRLEAEANHVTLLAEAGRLQADAQEHAANLKDELERAHAELSAQRQRLAEQDEQLACLEGHRLEAEANHATLLAEAGRSQADAEDRAAKLKDALERALAELAAQRQRAAEQDDQLADLEGRRLEDAANHATVMAESGRLRADAEEHAAQLKDELERALAQLSAQRQRAAEQDKQLADLEGRRSTGVTISFPRDASRLRS